MGVSRRGLLLGAAGLVVSRGSGAQGDREHRVRLELPLLAEDSTAVPIRVSVDHPMDPDHVIRSLTVAIAGDPVSAKGRFTFTPASGRALVGYQMRSGTGGLVRATAECSRHGRFTATQDLRVVEGGCTTPPSRSAGDRLGNPVIRLPRAVRAGEVVEVRVRLDHPSYTGLVLRNGRFVREQPEFFVRRMEATFAGEPVVDFELTSAVSPNPLIRFPLRVTRTGALRVAFTNSEGQSWEATETVRV